MVSLCGRLVAALSLKPMFTPLSVLRPLTSDMRTSFCPAGETSRTSRSPGNVVFTSLSWTFTSVIVPCMPPTRICDGYRAASVPGTPLSASAGVTGNPFEKVRLSAEAVAAKASVAARAASEIWGSRLSMRWSLVAATPPLGRATNRIEGAASRTPDPSLSSNQDHMATAETAPKSREERIDAQRRALPDAPGVYLFRGKSRRVLYVGKAKSIRKRVAGHFSNPSTRGAGGLIDEIEHIEALATETEAEALLLEQNFIRQYRPRYNVRLRDDKSYPYIAISLDEDFPRVYFTREKHRRDRAYFGPYSNAKRVRETLDLLG